MNDDSLVFFDNDCLASFLWVQRTDIIDTLFKGRIRIPSEVIREIEKLQFTPSGSRVYGDLLKFIGGHTYAQVNMLVTSETFKIYRQLTGGHFGRRMGSGEAAALAHAKQENGVVASNISVTLRTSVARMGWSL
ncbi:MAG TPA: hypothetical protein GXX51_03525 [Firmicutes bacterium]|nr:hypothetical protein [Bacillota bacterium]